MSPQQDQSTLYMGGLEFFVVRNGQAGRNIVQQYDAGTQLYLTRPLKDAAAQVPGFELAIEMPSLRACLDDVEYRMITTLASENTAEALRTPGGAQWLATRYNDQEADDEQVHELDDHAAPESLLPDAAPELQLGPTFIGAGDAVAVRVTVNIGQVRGQHRWSTLVGQRWLVNVTMDILNPCAGTPPAHRHLQPGRC